ncbi:MAG: hypothetical protein J6Y97_09150, partial [Prevotella sp.]|nr:hypothetical protein [Prevotella sp.]
MRIRFLTLLLLVFLHTNAQPIITRTSCNHQSGTAAIVDGKIRVGWQYADKKQAPIMQDIYQIRVHERLFHQKVYDSGKVHTTES